MSEKKLNELKKGKKGKSLRLMVSAVSIAECGFGGGTV
jgi:hypothetical protein